MGTLQGGLFKYREPLSTGDGKNGAANRRAREKQSSLWAQFMLTTLIGLNLKICLMQASSQPIMALLSKHTPDLHTMQPPWKFLTHPLSLLLLLMTLSCLLTRMSLLVLLIAHFLPMASCWKAFLLQVSPLRHPHGSPGTLETAAGMVVYPGLTSCLHTERGHHRLLLQ